MKSLGYDPMISVQAGQGGPQMRMAQNMSNLLGWGTDAHGNDKIVTRTVCKLYSKTDGAGRRRPVSSYIPNLEQSLRDGHLEDHLDRNDYMVSTEIETYYGRLTPEEYTVTMGTLSFHFLDSHFLIYSFSLSFHQFYAI